MIDYSNCGMGTGFSPPTAMSISFPVGFFIDRENKSLLCQRTVKGVVLKKGSTGGHRKNLNMEDYYIL